MNLKKMKMKFRIKLKSKKLLGQANILSNVYKKYLIDHK